MIRKTLLVAVSLLVVAASAFAIEAPTQANGVRPVHGKYVGEDHGDLNISFHFDGSDVSGFKVGHHEIGGTNVTRGVWHDVCRDGYCIKGHWKLNFHVVGYWRSPSGEWTAFHASAPAGHQAITPHPGVYSGSDVYGHEISFTYDDRHSEVRRFMANGAATGISADVTDGGWPETCERGFCAKGQWTSDGHVTGAWRRGTGDWAHFTASFDPPARLFNGRYISWGGSAIRVDLRYRDSDGIRPDQITHIQLNHSSGGHITVTNRHFDECFNEFCIKGHWQTSELIVGRWRRVEPHRAPEWHDWDAFAVY